MRFQPILESVDADDGGANSDFDDSDPRWSRARCRPVTSAEVEVGYIVRNIPEVSDVVGLNALDASSTSTRVTWSW